MRRRPLRLLAAITAAVLAAACSSGTDATATTDDAAMQGDLVVLAASSLTEALTTISRDFEAAHDGVHVRLTFDGSSRLATAILQGAPADLFLAADEATMRQVVDGDHVDGPAEVFATNQLEIVVPGGNPRAIATMEDLTRGVVVALCRSEVPCGAYAERSFGLAGLEVPEAGREENVKAVLSKVQLGEADAGIVYRTDVMAAAGVRGIEIPQADQVLAKYPAVLLRGATHPALAEVFLRYLLAEQAQRVLTRTGFGAP